MRKLSACMAALICLTAYSQSKVAVDERIHIHFDQPAYVAGDTMWFKAYVYADLKPTEQSTNFFLDLVDETGVVVSRKKYPLINGAAVGDIVLQASMKEGAYLVRAYTPNTLNAGSAYIYHRSIPVFNPSQPAPAKTPAAENFIIPVSSPGIKIKLDNSPEGKIIIIADEAGRTQPLSLKGTMFQYEMFTLPLKFSNKESKTLIPYDQLPSGVLHLQVTEAGKPIAHYQAWVDNKEYSLSVQFRTDTLNFAAGGRNVFSFSVPDTIAGTFSVVVTDADKELVPIQHQSIVSALLIGERAGDFDPETLKESQMNELMQKNVWNGLSPAKTKQVVDLSKEPVYLRISGKITGKSADESEIRLTLLTKDSSQTTVAFPVSGGSFAKDNIVYYDTATLSYDPAVYPGDLELSYPVDYSQYLPKENYRKLAANAYTFLNDASAKEKARSRFRSAPAEAIVKKTSREKKPKDDVNSRYTTGLFSGKNARSVDLINNPPTRGSLNVFELLQGEMAGLRIERGGGSYQLWSNRSPSTYEAIRGNSQGSVPVKTFLNEIETPASQIASIPVNQIALVKYFSPGNIMLPGVGVAGVFAVYTKKPGDSQMKSVYYPGYDEVHNFNPGSATRSTLYWEPNIVIEPGTARYSFSFNNSNDARRFHVVIKGFTMDGKLVSIDRVIEGGKTF